MTADGTKVMYSIAGAAQSLESIAHDEGNRLPTTISRIPQSTCCQGDMTAV